MEHFWNHGIWDLFEVRDFVLVMLTNFIDAFYENEYSWLFYFALFVPLMTFIFDLIMSFIFSVRFREVKFFNVLSPRSWRMLSGLNNSSAYRVGITDSRFNVRDFVARRFTLTPFAFRLSYKKAKYGDVIRSKDGMRSIYGGCKLSADGKTILYKYSTNNGIYFSTMKPYKWANSNGSQRMESVIHKSK